MKKNILTNRRTACGLLLGLLFMSALNATVTKFDAEAQTLPRNLIASHDSSSSEYKKNCTECHSNVLTEKSLNPSVPSTHVTMLPFTPGDKDKKCVWCHRTVDLVQGTQRVEKSRSNLRKGVNMTLCTLCHSPAGPGKEFFQTDLLPTPPDGPFLYDLVCAACHRDLADSQMRGKTAPEIQNAINKNKGGMGPLNVLSAEEIQAIASALAQ